MVKTEAALVDRLLKTSTATVTSLLAKSGVRNTWIRGANSLVPGQNRIVGRAFTMRFIAGREDYLEPDLADTLPNTRLAIEAMPGGSVAVVDSGGRADVGLFGDLLCGRMAKKCVAGLVSDGAVRDAEGVTATGLPVWSAGSAAPASAGTLLFVGWQDPIDCGGVPVFPDDMIVADRDGAVVIPRHLVASIAEGAGEFDAMEAWVADEIVRGVPLPGLYPMNAETRDRYTKWRNSTKAG